MKTVSLGVACAFISATTLCARNMQFANTVPATGDQNPYGVAVVEKSSGNLIAGHILVSNFNNGSNLQGTGSTIMDVAPDGSVAVFAQIDVNTSPASDCTGGIGLTTALVVLRAGWVIVGSLPTTDGMSDTAAAGCLLVLNNTGMVVETIAGSPAGPINGPWDMTAWEHDGVAKLFVTNVLNDVGSVAAPEGTVVRVDLDLTMNPPAVTGMTVIGSGFDTRTDPMALVIGPTGVALKDGTLYINDTLNNQIVAIQGAPDLTSSAGTGTVFSTDPALNGPLGLTIRPTTGELLAVNGGNGLLVVIGANGHAVQTKQLDSSGSPPGAGALFGLAPCSLGLCYVDDAANTLNVLTGF